MSEKDKPADGVWREHHWSDVNRPEGIHPYLESKTLAEKAAWDFVKNLPDGEKIELATVCPTYIFGPAKQKDGFTSGKSFEPIITGKQSPIPKSAMGVVDVRDVAELHVKAIKVPAAAGHRFFAQPHTPYRIEMAKILAEEFGPKGWPVCTFEGPDLNDPPSKVDISPATDILGHKFLPLKDTMIDMANSMIESGFA